MAGSKVPRPEAIAIGRRITEIRSAREMSTAELARQMGVRVQSVQQWESGQTTPKSARLAALARVLNCSVHLLTHDVATEDNLWNGTERVPVPQVRPVPIISWVQAGHWQEAMTPYELHSIEEHVPTRVEVSSRAFALRVRGDSMEPRFPEGCVIIVDPEIDARDGSFVVAQMDRTSEATFKRLVFDGPTRLLMPLNPRYPVMIVNDGTSIIGVIVEAYQKFI